jgi:glutamyl-tRNA reductase
LSILVVGLSHKSAPITTLERAAVGDNVLGKLLADIARLPDVAEVLVVSTCNRMEVYADVDRFHGAVNGVRELLSRHTGIAAAELTPSLYVHYEERAVAHLLAVASGLDSMVVGEDQSIGQVRTAIKLATEHGTLGRALGDLGRIALHAGKRARAETGIDRMGLSLAGVGINRAIETLGGNGSERGLAGRRVLVVGAGTMSGLAVATAARRGATRVVVVNRTRARAERLAVSVGGQVADLTGLDRAIADADLVISCTGASGLVITGALARDAVAQRQAGRPLVFLDLAMPRDIDPAVAAMPGVAVLGMDQLSADGHATVGAADLAAVRAIIEEELVAYELAVRAAQVTPIVVALRAKAATVVDVELTRLQGRLTGHGLTSHALEEISHAVRRVVDKLLHVPTVRVKELAAAPGGEDYAAALRVLFDLDPRAVEAVTRAEADPLPAADRCPPEQQGSQ